VRVQRILGVNGFFSGLFDGLKLKDMNHKKVVYDSYIVYTQRGHNLDFLGRCPRLY
jgi:hypothetical protein